MKKVLYVFGFFVLLFVLNIIFFYTISDYAFLLKKIKSNNELVYDESKIIDDDVIVDLRVDDNNKAEEDSNLDNKEIINTELLDNEVTDLDDNSEANIVDEINSGTGQINEIEEQENEENVKKLEEDEQKLLSEYDYFNGLEGFELNNYPQPIFAIFGQYDKKFEEYGNDDFIVYLFGEDYDTIKEYIELYKEDYLYEVNEVNNFGDKSSYINLKTTDNQVRLLIEKNNKTFGIIVEKEKYENVKKFLNRLIHN